MQARAKGERRLAFIPPVRPTGEPHTGPLLITTRTKRHVRHGDILDVVRRVLRKRQTTRRRLLTRDNIQNRHAAVLARVAAPQQRPDAGVRHERPTVDLAAAHLDDDQRLAEQRQLANDVEHVARPAQTDAVHALGLDRVVDAPQVQDHVGLARGGPDRVPEGVGRRIAVAGAIGVQDVVVAEELLRRPEGRVQVGRVAVVVALHLGGGSGPVANECDFLAREISQGKGVVAVLEEDCALDGGLVGEVLGCWGADVGPAEGSVRLRVRRIEVAQPHKTSIEPRHRRVQIRVVDQPLFIGAAEVVGVVRSAVEVRTSFQRRGGRRLPGIRPAMREKHILDSIAVRRDPVPFVRGAPIPVVPQDIIQQPIVGTSRHAIDGVIRAHESADFGVAGAGLEGREVVLDHVLLGDGGIKLVAVVAVPALDVVPGKVLACGDNLFVLAIDVALGVVGPLQACDEGLDVRTQVEGVLAGGFLATAPSRVTKRVDILCVYVFTRKVSVG